MGCVPAAVIGLLLDDVFEKLFYNPTCVAIALIVFGDNYSKYNSVYSKHFEVMLFDVVH